MKEVKPVEDKPKRMSPDGKHELRSGIIRKGRKDDKGEALDLELQTQEEESDSHIDIYQNAEMLIEQIGDGSYTVGRLPMSQKKHIFFYLAVFHPLISRIIKLHTKLPLSSLRLQKPEHPVDIVQDYVFDYFSDIMENTHFVRELKKCVFNYWVFGEGPCLIEDDYVFLKDTIIDKTLKGIKLPELEQSKVEELEKINNAYNADPSKVTWENKLKVLNAYLLAINPNYNGIISIKALNPLFINSVSYNEDIDFYLYSLERSKGIESYSEGKTELKEADVATLKLMGYSQALIEKNLTRENTFIEIDNDPFNDDGLYIARLSTDENSGVDSSILNSVLESASQNLLAIRKSNALVALASKIDRIISAPQASYDQLAQLQDDLTAMAEEPEGSMLAVNYEVSVDTLDLSVKDSLDLNDTIDRTNSEILSNMGMPEELISEGGSYGSGFLKVELLTNEYAEFRNALKDFIEIQIFKPIAIKKGFLTLNQWGKVVPLYPTIRFDKFSISRGSEDISQMMSLVSENHLPVEILLEHLGYNAEDIEQKLLRQQTTVFNSASQDLVKSAITGLEEELMNNVEFKDRVMDIFGLKVTKEPVTDIKVDQTKESKE